MQCKHQYYRYDKNGVLVCSQCGEPSTSKKVTQPVIEDKVEKAPVEKKAAGTRKNK